MSAPTCERDAQSAAASTAPPAADCCSTNAFLLVGTVPKVGPFPELQTWRCARCGHVVTVEAP